MDLIKQSPARQIDVADQWGEQVRAAVEVFVRALDEADRSAGGAILAGLALKHVYEMALSLMMRLVFVLYDRAYGLTHRSIGWSRIAKRMENGWRRRLTRGMAAGRSNAYSRLAWRSNICAASTPVRRINLRMRLSHRISRDCSNREPMGCNDPSASLSDGTGMTIR